MPRSEHGEYAPARKRRRSANTVATASAPTRKLSTARVFPAMSTQRRGWRTRRLRSVPWENSPPNWKAAIEKATAPNKTPDWVRPWLSPEAWASCAKVRSPWAPGFFTAPAIVTIVVRRTTPEIAP